MLKDRRKSERWSSPSRPIANILGLQHEVCGEVDDFSTNGFSLLTDCNLPTGTYLSVEIVFPPNNEVEIESRIAWRKKKKGNGLFEVGLIVLSHKNYERYLASLSEFRKNNSEDRRKNQRRLENKNSERDERRQDRRGLTGLRARIEDSAGSLDRFISTYTYERVIQSASAATVITHNEPKIMLGSNNYLGLTNHPKVKEAAIRATEKYGTGAGGVRVLSGTMDLHKLLEERLAEFKGTEACLLFPSGYSANFAALSAILEKGDIALNDKLNHASIVDGCRFTEGIIRFYNHNDMSSLERKLAQYDISQAKLVITDGVFSMDGNIAVLDKVVELGKKYNAMVMVDDAHATGVMGKNGRGSAEYCNVLGKIDITVVTLSKALGSIGGAVCGSRALIKRVFHHSRQFIFTSALPPAVCASVIAALEVIQAEPELLRNVHRNREFLWNGLKNLGYNVWDSCSAVIPVIVGDEVKAYKLAGMLDEMGVFVNAVSRPAVPRELSRLRVSVMATQTITQLEEALDAFKKAGKSLGIIN